MIAFEAVTWALCGLLLGALQHALGEAEAEPRRFPTLFAAMVGGVLGGFLGRAMLVEGGVGAVGRYSLPSLMSAGIGAVVVLFLARPALGRWRKNRTNP